MSLGHAIGQLEKDHECRCEEHAELAQFQKPNPQLVVETVDVITGGASVPAGVRCDSSEETPKIRLRFAYNNPAPHTLRDFTSLFQNSDVTLLLTPLAHALPPLPS